MGGIAGVFISDGQLWLNLLLLNSTVHFMCWKILDLNSKQQVRDKFMGGYVKWPWFALESSYGGMLAD